MRCKESTRSTTFTSDAAAVPGWVVQRAAKFAHALGNGKQPCQVLVDGEFGSCIRTSQHEGACLPLIDNIHFKVSR